MSNSWLEIGILPFSSSLRETYWDWRKWKNSHSLWVCVCVCTYVFYLRGEKCKLTLGQVIDYDWSQCIRAVENSKDTHTHTHTHTHTCLSYIILEMEKLKLLGGLSESPETMVCQRCNYVFQFMPLKFCLLSFARWLGRPGAGLSASFHFQRSWGQVPPYNSRRLAKTTPRSPALRWVFFSGWWRLMNLAFVQRIGREAGWTIAQYSQVDSIDFL